MIHTPVKDKGALSVSLRENVHSISRKEKNRLQNSMYTIQLDFGGGVYGGLCMSTYVYILHIWKNVTN